MYCTYTYASGVSVATLLSDLTKLCTGTVDITQLAGLVTYPSYSNITWTNSSPVGTGFSALGTNTLIGQYVHYNGNQIGIVVSNTDTTVTLDVNYGGTTGTGTTYITSVFGIWTAWQTAGWVTHDASAGTNMRVLRQPWDSSLGSGNVYMGIDTSQSGYVRLRCWESWNAVTHTGTNECYGGTAANTYWVRVATAASGTLYISSSPWHCCIHGYQSGTWGSSGTLSPMGIFQRTRRAPWDTPGNAYPPVVQCVGMNSSYTGVTPGSGTPMHSLGYAPRYCSTNATDVTGSSAVMFLSSPFGCSTGTGYSGSVPSNGSWPAGGVSTLVPNASKGLQHLFVPMWMVGNGAFLGGDLSAFSDMWSITYNWGSPLDTVVQAGKTYVVWPAGYSNVAWRYAVRRG